jgi:hypothetical protein
MKTLGHRIEAILASGVPGAAEVAENLRRHATPLNRAAIARLLGASSAVCEALREGVRAVERDGIAALAPDALYTSIHEAEPERRLWFDGFSVESGRLLVRLCVHQYQWSAAYGGRLVCRSRDVRVPVDEILGRGERR